MDLYVIIQLILISIVATTAMTWFSFAMSNQFQELYKETVLLSSIISQLNLKISAESKRTWGWIIHYAIGFLFVVGYHIIWIKDILSVSPLSALILGVISGVIGIISWMILFKITNHQPAIDFKGYYIQLFFAHIIFAFVATLLYHITLMLLIVTKAYVTF